MPFTPKKDPVMGWATPFVTGHKYKIHWATTGIDFEAMTATLSERYVPTDKGIYFVHNYSDVRSNFTVDILTPDPVEALPNDTITFPVNLDDPTSFTTGQNVHYGHNETR